MNIAKQNEQANNLLDENVEQIKLLKEKLKELRKILRTLRGSDFKGKHKTGEYYDVLKKIKNSKKMLRRNRIETIWLRIQINFLHFVIINIFFTAGLMCVGYGIESILHLKLETYAIGFKDQIIYTEWFLFTSDVHWLHDASKRNTRKKGCIEMAQMLSY